MVALRAAAGKAQSSLPPRAASLLGPWALLVFRVFKGLDGLK